MKKLTTAGENLKQRQQEYNRARQQLLDGTIDSTQYASKRDPLEEAIKNTMDLLWTSINKNKNKEKVDEIAVQICDLCDPKGDMLTLVGRDESRKEKFITILIYGLRKKKPQEICQKLASIKSLKFEEFKKILTTIIAYKPDLKDGIVAYLDTKNQNDQLLSTNTELLRAIDSIKPSTINSTATEHSSPQTTQPQNTDLDQLKSKINADLQRINEQNSGLTAAEQRVHKQILKQIQSKDLKEKIEGTRRLLGIIQQDHNNTREEEDNNESRQKLQKLGIDVVIATAIECSRSAELQLNIANLDKNGLLELEGTNQASKALISCNREFNMMRTLIKQYPHGQDRLLERLESLRPESKKWTEVMFNFRTDEIQAIATDHTELEKIQSAVPKRSNLQALRKRFDFPAPAQFNEIRNDILYTEKGLEALSKNSSVIKLSEQIRTAIAKRSIVQYLQYLLTRKPCTCSEIAKKIAELDKKAGTTIAEHSDSGATRKSDFIEKIPMLKESFQSRQDEFMRAGIQITDIDIEQRKKIIQELALQLKPTSMLEETELSSSQKRLRTTLTTLLNDVDIKEFKQILTAVVTTEEKGFKPETKYAIAAELRKQKKDIKFGSKEYKECRTIELRAITDPIKRIWGEKFSPDKLPEIEKSPTSKSTTTMDELSAHTENQAEIVTALLNHPISEEKITKFVGTKLAATRGDPKNKS
tara:strand:+ start:74 stop:2179 length:2106 start_codon:yes stop_codon:yes gene_type:complete